MQTQCIAPTFQVSNLDTALAYYKDILGFTEDFRVHDYAGISLGHASLHLCAHTFHNRPLGGGAAVLFCDEIDTYFAHIKSKGAPIVFVPGDRPYGMRDFCIADPDGNHLTFSCECRQASPAASQP